MQQSPSGKNEKKQFYLANKPFKFGGQNNLKTSQSTFLLDKLTQSKIKTNDLQQLYGCKKNSFKMIHEKPVLERAKTESSIFDQIAKRMFTNPPQPYVQCLSPAYLSEYRHDLKQNSSLRIQNQKGLKQARQHVQNSDQTIKNKGSIALCDDASTVLQIQPHSEEQDNQILKEQLKFILRKVRNMMEKWVSKEKKYQMKEQKMKQQIDQLNNQIKHYQQQRSRTSLK